MLRLQLGSLTIILALLASQQDAGLPQPEPSGQSASGGLNSVDGDSRSAAATTLRRLEARHLPNPIQVNDKILSGGLPEGDAAFAELSRLGVKTIISVDGMKPDVETAKRYGLRYVHLPHGYDGVPRQRGKELAKAVRDLEGPIYIHCHHGKHRSPAAASVACVLAGLIPPSQAMAILELAGTSPKYRGLYQSARTAQPLDAQVLDRLQLEFVESSPIPPMAEAMVAIEHTHEHLGWIAEAGWRTPADHPDLTPAHEALLMREHFAELLRAEEVRQEPVAFQQSLRASEQAAQSLEQALRSWQPTTPQDVAPAIVDQMWRWIDDNCKSCHEAFRDIPLGEK